MALVFADLVQETTSTTGTGTLTCTGAVAGFQTFAAIGNANTTYYRIKSGNDSEVGLGTYTSAGTTLSRDTVLYSTAGGTTKITVAAGATVICTYPAEKAVLLNAAGALVTTLDATINGITVGKGLGAVATNTAVGLSALAANTSGLSNAAFGHGALKLNTSANYNCAFGYQTLAAVTTSWQNSAFGNQALQNNTSGGNNVAFGHATLITNTSGSQNSAFGVSALSLNTTASNNSAFGYNALLANTTGTPNVAVGYQALQANTTASNNVAVGYQALTANTTGVATFGTITAGTAYTNGTYNGVAMSAVSGATFTVYPTVNITVAGGVVTVCTLVTAGTRATLNTATVLTVAAALIGGTGSGFTIPVATFAQGANNSAFGTSAGSAITTGANNVVIGSYTGAAAPISLTGSNYIVLSDGAANVRQTIDGSGHAIFGATIRTLGYTVATLPTGVTGMRAHVTDALAPAYGSTVVTGGAVTIPVFYNGTNWIVA